MNVAVANIGNETLAFAPPPPPPPPPPLRYAVAIALNAHERK